MRIAQLIDSLDPGGVENVAILLANEYQRKGHTTELWTFLEGGRWLDRTKALGIVVRSCIGATKFRRLLFFAAQIKRFRADVIHTHNVGGHPYVSVLAWAFRANAKIVNTRHGTICAPRGSYPWLLYRLSLPFTDHVTYLHEDDRAKLSDSRVKASSIVPNGVHVRPFHHEPKRISACPRWVTHCRLHFIKRLDLMLEAFALFRETYPKSELHIGGDGPEMDRLCRLSASLHCRNAIYFHGHVDDPAQFLPQFDGFLLTSDSEGMPMSVLEAMAAALPIVSRWLPGVEAIAPEGSVAWYTAASDAKSFCSAMIEAVESNDMRNRGRRAQALVLERNSIESVADRYLNLYKNLIERTEPTHRA